MKTKTTISSPFDRVVYGSLAEKCIAEVRRCLFKSERSRDKYYRLEAELNEKYAHLTDKERDTKVLLILGDQTSLAGQLAAAAINDNRWYLLQVQAYSAAAKAFMMARDRNIIIGDET